ncbi:V-type ATP synthase subunit E [Streptomyces noursei]|uniref:V-type ATP synthase subunit E n=1 Tax=Streptomyces noursei TaxID=1971 RepID=UPI0019632977|nr:V-type ATP synthase subunit E [Streptomyces noursei]QRX97521.1 V-type ATP synthase subunit E [Streptomyces noursei]
MTPAQARAVDPADPLAPVRTALLRAAEEEAHQLVAAARRDAEAVVAAARSRSTAVLREARRQGEQEGGRATADAMARTRHAVRAGVLRAQAEAYDELRRTVLAQVRLCRREPGYPAAREQLSDQARLLLGPEAVVIEHPRGGVIGTAGGRTVDLSLDALALRVFDGAGAGIESLWRT